MIQEWQWLLHAVTAHNRSNLGSIPIYFAFNNRAYVQYPNREEKRPGIVHLLDPEFHWLCQIATTLCKFHWQFWIIFLDAIAKAKKLIHESIAKNLKQVSLTKSFLALVMAFFCRTNYLFHKTGHRNNTENISLHTFNKC